jgi:hypothetical protein
MIGITSDKHDTYLSEMIPLLIEYSEDYCNRKFDELPAGVRIFVAKSCEFNLGDSRLSSRSMDTVSYSFNTEVPQSIKSYLRPYRRVSFS